MRVVLLLLAMLGACDKDEGPVCETADECCAVVLCPSGFTCAPGPKGNQVCHAIAHPDAGAAAPDAS